MKRELTALLILHDPMLARILASELARMEFQFSLFRNSDTALLLSGTWQFDLVIMEACASRTRDRDLVRGVRARQDGARIIAITGPQGNGDNRPLLDAGVDALVGRHEPVADLVSAVALPASANRGDHGDHA